MGRRCWRCGHAGLATSRRCGQCGALLAWRDWQVTRLLGQGGNGVVYLAERADTQAVLKIPAPHVTPTAHQIECRNLYLAASLDVAPQPIETARDGLLMAYEPTPSALPLRERARLFLLAVTRLHNRLLVHRDLKPDNVVGYRLVDLGSMVDLARDDEVEPVGTPGYAAPEAYRGVIAPSLDAYAAGWTLAAWLGGPEPDPSSWGPPTRWRCPDPALEPIIAGLLAPDPAQRWSVGAAAHALTDPWIRLPSGSMVASAPVTVAAWRQVTDGASCQDVCGYATHLDRTDVARYLARIGARLPTVAELRAVARGAERHPVWRDYARVVRDGLVSDLGARLCRRFLWQPTADGLLWGGTAYIDADTIPDPGVPNGMIGLRPARDC